MRSLIDSGDLDIVARLTVPGPDRLHIATVTKAVAKGDVESLRTTRSAPITLGRTADRMRSAKEATKRGNTVKQVEVLLGQLEAAFGVERDKNKRIVRDVDLTTITSEQCEAFLRAQAWAPRTQSVKRAYAKGLWQLAINTEAEDAERENRKPRIRHNPWARIETAEIVATRVIFLTAPERDAMLAKLAGTPLCAFMAVGYHAGLRVGEATHLRTGIDVDLTEGALRIQARPGMYEWAPKTKRGQRDVPINDALRAILEDHVARGFAGSRYFFRTPRTDKPLAGPTAHNWWRDAYTAAGIKHGRADADAVVYHTGRHTFASLLIQAGVSPIVVAELLGDNLKEVVDTYGHLTKRNLTDAVRHLC